MITVLHKTTAQAIAEDDWTPPPRRWRVDGIRKTKRQQKKRDAAWMGDKASRARLRREFPHLRHHHERVRANFVKLTKPGVIGRYYGVRIIEDSRTA